jgi:hypothetical protein
MGQIGHKRVKYLDIGNNVFVTLKVGVFRHINALQTYRKNG